jgi:hypothetical protein
MATSINMETRASRFLALFIHLSGGLFTEHARKEERVGS